MAKEKEDVIDIDFEDLKESDNILGKTIIALSIVLLVGLSIFVSIKGRDPLKDFKESNYIEIDTEKFYDLYKSSDKFVLLLGRPDCIWAKIEQEGTPSMGVFENQELVDSVSGEMTYDELTTWFRKVGVI